MKKQESAEQEAFITWCEYNEGKYPELGLIFHIPNGGSRNKLEAANLKRQGVKAGVPDLCLPAARGKYHGLYIEMKVDRNKPTENQERWIKRLTQQNYAVAVCYGADAAIETVKEYLNL